MRYNRWKDGVDKCLRVLISMIAMIHMIIILESYHILSPNNIIIIAIMI